MVFFFVPKETSAAVEGKPTWVCHVCIYVLYCRYISDMYIYIYIYKDMYLYRFKGMAQNK